VNGQLAVSAISLGGNNVTARRLYLTPVGGAVAKLAATIANNTATTATLNVADASLGVEAPTVNTTADQELVDLIQSVGDRAELETQRALLQQTWDLKLNAFPCADWIELPKPPLLSVTSVSYMDVSGATQALTVTTEYTVDAPAGPRCQRGRVVRAYGTIWPTTRDQVHAVTVRFVSGYGAAASAIPPLLHQALLLDAERLYHGGEPSARATEIYRRAFRSYPRQWAA
jgi:uncharacterized phiE125 gp8 family phage protein